MSDYLFLLAGIVFAAIGGEFFVRGSVGIATALRIPPGIIGVTVAAFATSSPELSVAVNSGLAGKSQISLGNALGSNIINVSLVLGIALLISGIPVATETLKRDVRIAIIAPVLTGIFLIDNTLNRLEGVFLLGVFATWLYSVVMQALHHRRSSSGGAKRKGSAMYWILAISGMTLLIIAGKLIVLSASGIARDFGVDDFIIGSTFVALGTTVPELASIIFSKIKGHDEIGLGTVLGSNIFNGLFIVSVASILTPIRVPFSEVVFALFFCILSLLIALPQRRTGLVRRRQGVLLVLMYSVYVMSLFFASR
ncbi:MAG: calcium/sodium antiporter [Chlorobaculum sp.]